MMNLKILPVCSLVLLFIPLFLLAFSLYHSMMEIGSVLKCKFAWLHVKQAQNQ